jgi:hypothetical protein
MGDERFPPFGTVPTRPRCTLCGDVIVVDLHADNDLWEAVMRDRFGPGYACVNCFASRADEKGIDWAPHVRLIPLSLAAQIRLQKDVAATLANGSEYIPSTPPPPLLGDWQQ